MEFLGAHITSMCEDKRWDMVKNSRSGPRFSHIFFAGDLMLLPRLTEKIVMLSLKCWTISATLLGRR